MIAGLISLGVTVLGGLSLVVGLAAIASYRS